MATMPLAVRKAFALSLKNTASHQRSNISNQSPVGAYQIKGVPDKHDAKCDTVTEGNAELLLSGTLGAPFFVFCLQFLMIFSHL